MYYTNMSKNITKQEDRQSNVDINKISEYELSRWAALQEAMEIIGDKCEERHINFETVELKPLEILKYIDNAADDIFYRNFGNNHINITRTKKLTT